MNPTIYVLSHTTYNLLVKSTVKVGHKIRRGPINPDGGSTAEAYITVLESTTIMPKGFVKLLYPPVSICRHGIHAVKYCRL